MTAVTAWKRFWFTPVPVARVSAFRVLIAAYVLLDVALLSTFVRSYPAVSDEFWRPITVFRILGIQLSPGDMAVLYPLLLGSVLLAVVGLLTRPALLLAAPLYFLFWGTYYSYGSTEHGRIIVLFALGVLAIAPSGERYSLDSLITRWRRRPPDAPLSPPSERTDELAQWALRVVMVLVVAAYMFAAYSKLRVSGLGWITSDALTRVLIEKNMPLGVEVARHTLLVQMMQALTLLLEATAFVALFGGRIRDSYFVVMVLFHIGTIVLLNIEFVGLMMGYLAFYRLEHGAEQLGRWGRQLAPALRRPAPG